MEGLPLPDLHPFEDLQPLRAPEPALAIGQGWQRIEELVDLRIARLRHHALGHPVLHRPPVRLPDGSEREDVFALREHILVDRGEPLREDRGPVPDVPAESHESVDGRLAAPLFRYPMLRDELRRFLQEDMPRRRRGHLEQPVTEVRHERPPGRLALAVDVEDDADVLASEGVGELGRESAVERQIGVCAADDHDWIATRRAVRVRPQAPPDPARRRIEGDPGEPGFAELLGDHGRGDRLATASDGNDRARPGDVVERERERFPVHRADVEDALHGFAAFCRSSRRRQVMQFSGDRLALARRGRCRSPRIRRWNFRLSVGLPHPACAIVASSVCERAAWGARAVSTAGRLRSLPKTWDVLSLSGHAKGHGRGRPLRQPARFAL